MKKFCCERFSTHYSINKEMGMNIRVVKLSEAFIKRGEMNIDRIFLVTEGYSENNFMEGKHMVIEYCPFCSTKLKTFYESDDYVQETLDIPKKKE